MLVKNEFPPFELPGDNQQTLQRQEANENPFIENVEESSPRFCFSNTINSPSPPQSQKYSLLHWAYNDAQYLLPAKPVPLDDFHLNYPNQPHVQYGPMTSPDDCLPTVPFPRTFLQPPDCGKQKRRHTITSIKDSAKLSQQPRKYNRQSKVSIQTRSTVNASNCEDEKRIKFLKKNREAASKCRQKRKKWIFNLESQARELKNSKDEHTMMIGSLENEMKFLKVEMLKHKDCTCQQIEHHLSTEVNNDANGTHDIYRALMSDASPIETPPDCPVSGANATSPHERPQREPSDFDVHEPLSEHEQFLPTPPFKSQDELEAFLERELAPHYS